MFKIIKRTTVYESKWLTLYEELLDCGNNRRELYNKVLTFDTAHIVPIFNDGSLLMVENYRHGVGKQLLELPGGFINPGETPTHAAGRELLEETGYAARVLNEISFHYTWPGRCTQKKPCLSCPRLVQAFQPDTRYRDNKDSKIIEAKSIS